MRKLSIGEVLVLLIVLLPFVILAVVFSAGFVRTYRNSTSGMEPTLPMGSRIAAIPTKSIRRGDLVTFVYPLDPRVTFAKRIVALGGDVVEIKGKRLFVNGKEIDEPYAVHADSVTYPRDERLPEPYRSRDWFGPYSVPAGMLFVLGDNRDRSADSRYWGTVPQENVRGRVVVAFSWSRGFWKPR